jgi:cell pole-organizing protein PopZ
MRPLQERRSPVDERRERLNEEERKARANITVTLQFDEDATEKPKVKTKPFQKLLEKLSPKTRARVEERVQKELQAMGEVLDEVKGSAPKNAKRKASAVPAATDDAGNMVTRVRRVMDDISELIAKKDEETLTEGVGQEARNRLRASKLRHAHMYLRSALTELEDYDRELPTPALESED